MTRVLSYMARLELVPNLYAKVGKFVYLWYIHAVMDESLWINLVCDM